ncbi:MAG: DUF2490 domain-containing protein [Gammaproteobacteria bacterium]
MNRHLLTTGLALLACLIASAPARAERDSGASHNLLLKAKLNDDWFVISRSNVATRNDFGQDFLAFTGAGLGYQVDDHWSLRGGYRHVWFRPVRDWLEEDRFYAEAYYARRFDQARFTSRSRAEFRFFDYQDDELRLRNEFVIEANAPLPGTDFRPYLEEEFFIGGDDGRLEANWLGVGLAWRPMDGVKIKVGYRWNRFRVGSDWRHRDVLVTGVNLFF